MRLKAGIIQCTYWFSCETAAYVLDTINVDVDHPHPFTRLSTGISLWPGGTEGHVDVFCMLQPLYAAHELYAAANVVCRDHPRTRKVLLVACMGGGGHAAHGCSLHTCTGLCAYVHGLVRGRIKCQGLMFSCCIQYLSFLKLLQTTTAIRNPSYGV